MLRQLIAILFTHTLTSWLIWGAVTALLAAAFLTVKYWRDSKRSPYYFLRRQSEQRMQSYSLATIVCAVALIFLASYAVQPQRDSTLRVAFITSSKPISQATNANTTRSEAANRSADSAVEAAAEPEVVEIRGANLTEAAARLGAENGPTGGELALNAITTTTPELAAVLPPEFDQFTAQVALTDETLIADLQFSTTIDEVKLIALTPERVFGEGSYTIYATFAYDGMQDGMVWSWVWRRDGQVVSGGNEMWNYGVDGPGYVFYNPREGFRTGEYTLEIWVNGRLMNQANLFITNDIAASR